MTPLTSEHLAEVAKVYSAAVPRGRPAVAVAEHWKVPVKTAQRWAMKARATGHLPPAQQGLASGDTGCAALLAAELGIAESNVSAALRKYSLRLSTRRRDESAALNGTQEGSL